MITDMIITDFTALALRLPLLDTATLSQAWRDALHQTVTVPLRSRTPGTQMRACSTKPFAAACSHYDVASFARSEARSTGGRHTQRAGLCTESERLRYRPHIHHENPARIASDRLYRPREKHVISLPNGERICFLLAPLPTSLHVTVLCAPHLQSDIRRALAMLAQTLAERAIGLNVMPSAEIAAWIA